MQRMFYTNGQILGNNIIFLNEVSKKRKNYTRALFKCHCGKVFESDISPIKSLNTKSCGCLNTSDVRSKRETTHGYYGHTVYRKWISMKERCYRVKAFNYHKYGGRGIQVCEEWKDDFLSYYNYVINLDGYNEDLLKQNKLSIDRKDNNGNYEPGNLRITDWHMQSVNQRIQNNNTSGNAGVSFDKHLRKWISRITVYNKRIYLGVFEKKQDAINKRLKYIKDNNLNEYL
ncbi:MAG: hypothetical protein WC222_11245 [Parachlamydiales bacterium]